MKISVVMIAKNEEEMIKSALDSVKDADEIILCDTGSTDATMDIALSYPNVKLVEFRWVDDFSAARNFAKSYATGDWIFSLDADHIVLNDFETIRSEVEIAERASQKAALVKAGQSHYMSVLFKNIREILWVERCHECLNVATEFKTKIEMQINSSSNHKKDPERNLRILLHDVNLERNYRTPRNKFYLARTYWEMNKWESAAFWMQEYLKEDVTFLAERAEAFYVMAHALWKLDQGDGARHFCMKALEVNANFKKAALLMAEISWEKSANTWKRLADICTNEDVLFT